MFPLVIFIKYTQKIKDIQVKQVLPNYPAAKQPTRF